MKNIKLSELACQAGDVASVIRDETHEMAWTDRLAAGEKPGSKTPSVSAALWTTDLQSSTK